MGIADQESRAGAEWAEEAEHRQLQRVIGSVLDAYAAGRIDRNRATGLLSLLTVAAKTHETGEFGRILGLDPEVYVEA